ncbi:Uncharacterized protein Rs2_29061 [Raphanus sativus]|nr:Uncharacterized protein Rs2_29061 [Raphanus sativus]
MASVDVISVAIASGREPRRVQLVFVVKSQRKLRLRQNEKRFEEESKENTNEESFEALQVAIASVDVISVAIASGREPRRVQLVAIASVDVISVAIASGREPRRVQLVFVVKSQRKLRLRRNEKRFEENSKENAEENSSWGSVAIANQAWLAIATKLVSVLGRYSDRACLRAHCSVAIATELVSVLGRYSDRACLGVRSL